MTKIYYKENGTNEYIIFYKQNNNNIQAYLKKDSQSFFEAAISEHNIENIQYPENKIIVNIGELYPRIWRIGIGENDMKSILPQYDKIFRNSIMSTDTLIHELKDIFNTIHPNSSNLNSFGMKTRNLLLLSCMEVESSFIGILKANNYRKERYSTNDYVKLLEPLKLNKYSIKWIEYPELEEQRPFENWNSSNPTTSLDWYNQYNKTKHNREENLSNASLEMVIKSVSAMAIMLYAQFGEKALLKGLIINDKPIQFYIRDTTEIDTSVKIFNQGEGFSKKHFTFN